MTPSRASLRVQTKMGPTAGSAGKGSPRFITTSPATPMSASAWPTRPPPTMIAGATEDDAMTAVARRDARRAERGFPRASGAADTREARELAAANIEPTKRAARYAATRQTRDDGRLHTPNTVDMRSSRRCRRRLLSLPARSPPTSAAVASTHLVGSFGFASVSSPPTLAWNTCAYDYNGGRRAPRVDARKIPPDDVVHVFVCFPLSSTDHAVAKSRRLPSAATPTRRRASFTGLLRFEPTRAASTGGHMCSSAHTLSARRGTRWRGRRRRDRTSRQPPRTSTRVRAKRRISRTPPPPSAP